jgi:hypothetical protein
MRFDPHTYTHQGANTMSMHKKPLTAIEESGLRAHGLDIGTPSQLSDVFRQGVAWAQKAEPVATVYERADGFGVHIHGSVYSGQPLYAARMTDTPDPPNQGVDKRMV